MFWNQETVWNIFIYIWYDITQQNLAYTISHILKCIGKGNHFPLALCGFMRRSLESHRQCLIKALTENILETQTDTEKHTDRIFNIIPVRGHWRQSISCSHQKYLQFSSRCRAQSTARTNFPTGFDHHFPRTWSSETHCNPTKTPWDACGCWFYLWKWDMVLYTCLQDNFWECLWWLV